MFYIFYCIEQERNCQVFQICGPSACLNISECLHRCEDPVDIVTDTSVTVWNSSSTRKYPRSDTNEFVIQSEWTTWISKASWKNKTNCNALAIGSKCSETKPSRPEQQITSLSGTSDECTDSIVVMNWWRWFWNFREDFPSAVVIGECGRIQVFQICDCVLRISVLVDNVNSVAMNWDISTYVRSTPSGCNYWVSCCNES